MLKNVKCARCVRCGKEYEAVPNLTNCSCGGILDIVYDYDYIKAHLTKETLKNRVNPTMWRYRELLPVEGGRPLGVDHPAQAANGGGLAGAVRSEDDDDLTLVHVEVHAVQDADRSVGGLQTGDFEQAHSALPR